jgi:hypothetical protein
MYRHRPFDSHPPGQISFHLSVSATSPTIMLWRELQKESCCMHLGRPGPTTQVDTKPLSVTCLCCPVADLFLTTWICKPFRGTQHTVWGDPHILAQLGNWFHPVWTKLVAKYRKEIFSHCLRWGKEQNRELKKPLLGRSDSAAAVGYPRHCTALEKPGARRNWQSHQEKSSSLTHRLALWVERVDDCSFTNPSGTSSENLPAPEAPPL